MRFSGTICHVNGTGENRGDGNIEQSEHGYDFNTCLMKCVSRRVFPPCGAFTIHEDTGACFLFRGCHDLTPDPGYATGTLKVASSYHQ